MKSIKFYIPLVLILLLSFKCNKKNDSMNNCSDEIKKNIEKLSIEGKGHLILNDINCSEWNNLLIVEPYFNVADIEKIAGPIPAEMMKNRQDENYFHLLFLNSNKISMYIPVSSKTISFSGMVTGKESYNLISKNNANFNIFTSDDKIYNSDKNVIKAELLK